MSAFPSIDRIRYEGPKTRNPLAFRHYAADELVEGKSLRDHLRFSVVFWHTFRNPLSDPFGAPTALRPWDDGSPSLENAIRRVRVAFEFLEKLSVPFFAFHDRDLIPEAATWSETNHLLDQVVDVVAQEQERTKIRLLWGTANLFSHPRYVHGAATSSHPEVFACAAAQVKKALEVTHRLGGRGYVFWGGREGYQSLWNTEMQRERERLARFMHLACDYARQIGFSGQFYIEPKPKEPTKHQYDTDVAACLNFLREFELLGRFQLNLETNHATLAGHTIQHELESAGAAGVLGSIDANTGDPLLGWDTDQFPTDIYLTTTCMYTVLKYGGFRTGGVNFDAKVRRESFEPEDLFHAHIGGMDAFARGLKIASAIRQDGRLSAMLADRYAGWSGKLGLEIDSGQHSFESLARVADNMVPQFQARSGRQEAFENLINDFIV